MILKENRIEQIIYDETEKRLAIMQDKEYSFPAPAGIGDVVAIVAGIAVSAALIILCMCGVII